MENFILLQWIKDIFGCTFKSLFCYRPDFLLTFVGIGIAIVIFSLRQSFMMLEEGEGVKKIILGRKKLTVQEHRHFRGTQKYLTFLAFIQSVGIFYFLAVVPLLLLLTYPEHQTSSISSLYIFLNNISYLFIFIPTVLISLYYAFFKIFQHRIH